MLDFIIEYSGYVLLFIINTLIIVRILLNMRGRGGNNDGGGGGEFWPEDPVLDLPPGVVLPSDAPKKEMLLQD